MSCEQERGKSQSVSVSTIIDPLNVRDDIEMLITCSFASKWFKDALREARMSDYDSRRREIIFAVCFAESYLVEWVRDEVLVRGFQKFNHYFPSDRKRGVCKKWKEIPKQLYCDGLIPKEPNYDATYWDEFTVLVKYRNGLIHAAVSRPVNITIPPRGKSSSGGDIFHYVPQGRATRVVVELVKRLHEAVGTPTPAWLVVP